MRGLLIDVWDNEVKEVEASTLDEYYKLIECDTIDIVYYMIGSRYYNIICDDEGLLKDSILVSAFDKQMHPVLVGNLLIFGDTDDDGGLTSLTGDDIVQIKEKIMEVSIKGVKHPVLSDLSL